MATIRRLGLVVLIAGALSAPATAAMAQAPAPRVPPGIGVKLLQGPADSVNNPRAHEYIIDHLAPGTTISRQIGFSNGDPQPVNLTFYPDAAQIQGGIFRPGPGHAANELTSWMTFSPTAATVQPGQTLAVTLTIAVPADATSGERYAAALAQDAPTPVAGGITSVSRIGMRIYLSVGPGGAPTTAFTINSITAERDASGNPFVTAAVHNTGGRAVDLSGQLRLTDGQSSLSAGPFPVGTVATLAPGQSGQVSVPLSNSLPDGPWDARITLVSGLTSETATARITFPSASGGAGATVLAAGAPRHSHLSLFLLGGAVAALLLLCALFVRSRRRRARDNVPASTVESPIRASDTTAAAETPAARPTITG